MLRETQTQSDSVSFSDAKSVPKVPSFKFKKPVDDIDKAIQCFLKGDTGKFGKYIAVKNALVYRTVLTSRNGTKQELGQNIIALKIERDNETLFIGNSSVLPLIGRTSAWGRESLNSGVTDVQTRLSRHVQMIPFSVFSEAGLDLTKIKILDRGPETTVTRTEDRYNSKTRENDKIDVDVHFTGASLFQVENSLFLFDIDRREIKHKIFNAFLVELKVKASTVAEAYETLKPQDVKDAEAKGLEVKRQGEWFFIPVKGNYEATKARPNRWDKKDFEPLELRAGRNRPNNVSKYATLKDGTHVVTGYVEHSGREHAKLVLDGWFKAVPNTSVQSFTITGDVD